MGNLILSLWVDQFPDSREVMVVVLRNEIQVIDEPHRLLETRVQHGAREEIWLKFRYALHQAQARGAELGQNPGQLPGIVISFVRSAIAQVGNGKGVSIFQKIVYPREP